MLLIESNPCPEQRTLLEHLGFALKMTNKVGICVWEFQSMVIELHDTSVPTIAKVLTALVEVAQEHGRKEVRKKILVDLGVPTEVLSPLSDSLGAPLPTDG